MEILLFRENNIVLLFQEGIFPQALMSENFPNLFQHISKDDISLFHHRILAIRTRIFQSEIEIYIIKVMNISATMD